MTFAFPHHALPRLDFNQIAALPAGAAGPFAEKAVHKFIFA